MFREYVVVPMEKALIKHFTPGSSGFHITLQYGRHFDNEMLSYMVSRVAEEFREPRDFTFTNVGVASSGGFFFTTNLIKSTKK